MPKIPNPKHPKLCPLPWKDPPSLLGMHLPESQSSEPTAFCLEPLNFAPFDLEIIDNLVKFSQSKVNNKFSSDYYIEFGGP